MKIDIICGFLKSGKTTFIKKLVHDYYKNEFLVILINEFGNATFSQEEIAAYLQQNILIEYSSSGCICCQGNDIFIQNIERIVAAYHPDRIVIEPACTANISDLLCLFESESLSGCCELEHLITMVDVERYAQRMKISEHFLKQQLRESSFIFLNHLPDSLSKRCFQGQDSIESIISEIHALSPACRIVKKDLITLQTDELQYYMTEALLTCKPRQKRMRYK